MQHLLLCLGQGGNSFQCPLRKFLFRGREGFPGNIEGRLARTLDAGTHLQRQAITRNLGDGIHQFRRLRPFGQIDDILVTLHVQLHDFRSPIHIGGQKDDAHTRLLLAQIARYLQANIVAECRTLARSLRQHNVHDGNIERRLRRSQRRFVGIGCHHVDLFFGQVFCQCAANRPVILD